MLVTGLVLAACAAVTHTCIDTLRKYASTTWGISNDGLVTVPALLDAVSRGGGGWAGYGGNER